LSKIIQEKVIQTLNLLSLQESILLAKNYQNHEKLIEGIDYFVEQGCYVFTKWYHLKSGICCGNGCRNCPY
jgi:shikimate 5-dehydrogenase